LKVKIKKEKGKRARCKTSGNSNNKIVFMKKTLIIIIPIFLVFITTINAQFSNTKWKGILNMDGAVPVVWQFDKDTVQVFNIADSSLVEKMTYKTEPGFLLLTKVSGISSCDTTTIGKYKFSIRSDSLFIAPFNDPCYDRASAVSSEACIRIR
jgi:hypothetical protein